MSLKCLFGHQWHGCKCERCGKTQNTGHNYVVINGKCIEKCSICGKEGPIEHNWSGCKCERCGITHDSEHMFIPIPDTCLKKCSVCGKEMPNHDIVNNKCSHCGKNLYKITEILDSGECEHVNSAIEILTTIGIIKLANDPKIIKITQNQELELDSILQLSSVCLEFAKFVNTKPAVQAYYAQLSTKLSKTVQTLLEKQKSAPTITSTIQYDNGKMISVDVNQISWSLQTNGGSNYYSHKADSLFVAGEILKKLSSIPSQTYYLVDTPDGTLGRDINGFFTEAPIKSTNLKIDNPCGKTGSVQAQSLMGFGNMMNNQNSVALQQMNGQYAKLILMMKCGQCGYESPVETVSGDMERQCYSCGTNNKTFRGIISVYTPMGAMEV